MEFFENENFAAGAPARTAPCACAENLDLPDLWLSAVFCEKKKSLNPSAHKEGKSGSIGTNRLNGKSKKIVSLEFLHQLNPGLGTAFFPVQNVPLFPVF